MQVGGDRPERCAGADVQGRALDCGGARVLRGRTQRTVPVRAAGGRQAEPVAFRAASNSVQFPAEACGDLGRARHRWGWGPRAEGGRGGRGGWARGQDAARAPAPPRPRPRPAPRLAASPKPSQVGEGARTLAPKSAEISTSTPAAASSLLTRSLGRALGKRKCQEQAPHPAIPPVCRWGQGRPGPSCRGQVAA